MGGAGWDGFVFFVVVWNRLTLEAHFSWALLTLLVLYKLSCHKFSTLHLGDASFFFFLFGVVWVGGDARAYMG